MTREEKFMMEAIALSEKAIAGNMGGPFGCVVVKGEEIVGRGNNSVIANTDPTAHAEVMAIRDACRNLGTFQLDDCEIFTSCEPCPMCLGAIYWARPRIVYYANTRHDASSVGFDDSFIYKEINEPMEERKIPFQQIKIDAAILPFKEWNDKNDKIKY